MMLVAFCLILFTFIFVLYMKKKICFFFDAYFRRVICMAGIYQLTLSSVDHMCSHLNTFVFVSFISYLSEIFRNDVSFLSNFSWRENHFLYYPIFFFLFFTKASSSFSWEIISYYETKLKEIVWLTSLNSFGNKAKIVSLWNIWIFFQIDFLLISWPQIGKVQLICKSNVVKFCKWFWCYIIPNGSFFFFFFWKYWKFVIFICKVHHSTNYTDQESLSQKSYMFNIFAVYQKLIFINQLRKCIFNGGNPVWKFFLLCAQMINADILQPRIWQW